MNDISAGERFSESERWALAQSRPMTPDQLHLWVGTVLDLDMPREPVCTELGHQAPFDYVRDAYFERFTDAVIWANRGGGKTMLGAVVSLLDARWKPGTAIRILGGSLEQSQKMYRYLTDMVQRRFRAQLAGRAGGPGGAGSVDGLGGKVSRGGIGARTLRFANGSEVEILAQSERSVRGNRVQKMRCDEIELFDSDVWTSCQLVTESREEGFPTDYADYTDSLRGNEAAPAAKSTGNPKSGCPIRNPKLIRGAVEAFSTFHRVGGLMQHVIEQANRRGSPVYRWCVLDVLERCPADRPCGGCPLADECRGRAKKAAGFYRIDDAIAAKARVSKETWESEMLCLRPSRRGAVFPTFDRARHVEPVPYQPRWPMFRAIDFGFVNPFVCLWLQTSPAGDVFVVGEYLRSRATIGAHVAMIRQLDSGPVRMTYCDPAGGQADQITGTSARAELRSAGIDTRARQSAITDGLELIRRYLDGGAAAAAGAGAAGAGDGRAAPAQSGGPVLRIDPSCERLITAMEAYRYPDASDGRGRSANSETPLKDGVHDHPIDALRYFFVNHIQANRGTLVERAY